MRRHVDRAGLNPSTRWHQQPKQDIIAICSLVSINLFLLRSTGIQSGKSRTAISRTFHSQLGKWRRYQDSPQESELCSHSGLQEWHLQPGPTWEEEGWGWWGQRRGWGWDRQWEQRCRWGWGWGQGQGWGRGHGYGHCYGTAPQPLILSLWSYQLCLSHLIKQTIYPFPSHYCLALWMIL